MILIRSHMYNNYDLLIILFDFFLAAEQSSETLSEEIEKVVWLIVWSIFIEKELIFYKY